VGVEPLVGWRELLEAIRARFGRGLSYGKFLGLVKTRELPSYTDSLRMDRYRNPSRRYRVSEVLAALDLFLKRAA